MRITQINNQSSIHTTDNNSNFRGKILTRGEWTPRLEKAFLNNPEINEVANKTNLNIIGVMAEKLADGSNQKHYPNQSLYKLTLKTEKDKPTLVDKIKDFFGLNKELKITKNYHSEYSMENLIIPFISTKKIEKDLDL